MNDTGLRAAGQAVEQIHLVVSGKLLILRVGELLLSENSAASWQVARPGFDPAADISAFATLPGLDSTRNFFIGLPNGEIIKL